MVEGDSWWSIIFISMEECGLGFCDVHFKPICPEVPFKPMEVVLDEV